jgi:hypothetical protein
MEQLRARARDNLRRGPCSGRLRSRAQPSASGFVATGGGNKPAHFAETEWRHPAVDRFVVVGLN